jgi:hypothetical protein
MLATLTQPAVAVSLFCVTAGLYVTKHNIKIRLKLHVIFPTFYNRNNVFASFSVVTVLQSACIDSMVDTFSSRSYFKPYGTAIYRQAGEFIESVSIALLAAGFHCPLNKPIPLLNYMNTIKFTSQQAIC